MKHSKHYDTDEATSKRMSRVKLKKGDAETLLAKKGFDSVGRACGLMIEISSGKNKRKKQ